MEEKKRSSTYSKHACSRLVDTLNIQCD